MWSLEQSDLEIERRLVIARNWGQGSCLMGAVSVEEDKNVLDMDGADGHTTV